MTSNESELDLGLLSDFPQFPAALTLNHDPYFLIRLEDGGYRLLSGLCPHAGGEVRLYEDMLLCPLHFWTFDATSGVCKNVSDERLLCRDVIERDGRLYAIGSDH